MGSAVDLLLAKFARVYVPPHVRIVDGKKIHVDGYTREQPASWWEVARSFWEHSIDRPVKFDIEATPGFYESVPSTKEDATVQAQAWDTEQLRRRYDATNAIWNSKGSTAARLFDWEMADVIRFERADNPPRNYALSQQLKLIHGNDPDAIERQREYVGARVSNMKIENADPKLVEKVRTAWDNVSSQPNMRPIFDRYGDIPVYVATRWAEAGHLTGEHFASAQAAYHRDLGLVYYDHTADGYEALKDSALRKVPSDLEMLKPDQIVLNESRELILRHEYGHRVRDIESDFHSDWYLNEWIPAWQQYANQIPVSDRLSAGRSMMRIAPKGSISDYSYANESESFAEVFALVTDPKWSPEMIDNYSPEAQKLIRTVLSLLNRGDRNLVDEYIGQLEPDPVANLAAKVAGRYS